jgi:hypothetical protein
MELDVVARRASASLALALALAACHPGEKHGSGPAGPDTLVGSWAGPCTCANFRDEPEAWTFDGFPTSDATGIWHRESRQLVSLELTNGGPNTLQVETVQVDFEDDTHATLSWSENGGLARVTLTRTETGCGVSAGGDP